MSIQYCHKCGKNIDTDYDAEHFIYVHPTHCKYGDKEAVKSCDVCGMGLCTSCGYTIDGKETSCLCNECYAQVMNYMDEDTL